MGTKRKSTLVLSGLLMVVLLFSACSSSDPIVGSWKFHALDYNGEYLAYEEANQLAYRDLELLALADLGLPEPGSPLFAERRPAGSRPRALDVGCATGALLDALRDRGWDAAGVELCAPAAAYGRARFGAPR